MPTSMYQVLQARQAELRAEANAIIDAAAGENRLFSEVERARLDAVNALLEAIDADIGRLAVDRERLRDAPALLGRVEVGRDLAADMPWGYQYGVRLVAQADGQQVYGGVRNALAVATGEFLQAVYAARFGRAQDPRLVYEAAAQGAGEAVNADGGYLVGSQIENAIMLHLTGGQVLSRVNGPRTMGAGLNSLEINVIDETSRATGSRFGAVQGYWVDEGTAPAASRPRFARFTVKPRKVAALGYASDELLQDASLLGDIMLRAFREELLFLTEDAIIEGTGAGQPQGILNAACLITVAAETGQAAATIVNENISKMWARFDARSRANGVWFYNQDDEPQLDSLTLVVGTAGLEPRFVTYGTDGVLRIKGRPAIAIEYCSTLGTVGDLILADMSQYLLVDKGTPQQASSIHVAFTTDEQAFRVVYRVDGQAMWRSALTPFKGTNTVSPFVALATRA